MNTTEIKRHLGEKLQAKQPRQQRRQPKSTEGRITTMQDAIETNVNADDDTTATGNATPAPMESGYAALTTDALDIICENLKNQPLSHGLFDVVKSPAGGTTAFSVPGLSGDEIRKELAGIILDYTTPRAYWETQEPKEGEPPACFSRDSVVSHDGRPCSLCANNDFGSRNGGETRAKACKEQILIFLLRRDNILPLVVRVPVSSKMSFMKYTTRLVGNMTPIYGVVTKITLEKATNKTGQPYSRFGFEAVGSLGPGETAAAKAFGRRLMETVAAADAPVIMAETG